MRRSNDGFGAEPCTRRTWCNDISPGRKFSGTDCDSSTSTAISWPRVKRLWRWNVSRCGIWSSLWLPGMTAMAPFAALLGVSATHAVATSGEKRKEEMRLVPEVAAQRPTHLRLDRFELLAQGERLILRHDLDRREIACFVVLRDLGFGQQFRHGSAPPGNEPVY